MYYDSISGVTKRKEWYDAGDHYHQWIYAPNGNLLSRGEARDGKKDGSWMYYDTAATRADTMPWHTAQYKAGQLHGAEKKYRGGQLWYYAEYNNGVLHGSRKLYGPKGALISEEDYSQGKLHGAQKKYSLAGKQFTGWNYLHGEPDGACVTYDTLTGALWEERNYENGTLINMKRYSVQHKLTAEQLLIERDSLVYSLKEYYDNGAKKSGVRLIGTRRTGTYESWFPNGKKSMIAFFRNDRYYGNVTVWNDKGIKVLSAKSFNGRDTVPEDVWSDGGAKLAAGTLTYDRQRAKYIPLDLVPYYEEMYTLGDIMVNLLPPRGPWQDWSIGVALGGHLIGTEENSIPRFTGGPEAERQYFESNTHYPEYEREQHITGKNVVTFTVRADGSVTAIDLHRSASPGLDAEALRLVRGMPDWVPAKVNGVPREGRCWIEFEWEIKELRTN
jgi:TonB family protein